MPLKTRLISFIIRRLFMFCFLLKQTHGNSEEIVDRSLSWTGSWCSIPPSISNGNVSSERPVDGGQFFSQGTTLTVTCQSGYRLLDPQSNVLECKDGNWTSSAKPECKAWCQRPLVQNGDVTNVGTEFSPETTLEVLCNEGYRLANKFVNTLQCGRSEDGIWSGHNGGYTRETPECVLATCPPLPITPNSILQYRGTTGWDGGFQDGSKVSFACRQGFRISFEDGGPIDREFKCRNGMWQDLVPVACDVTGCGPPSTVLHAEPTVVDSSDSTRLGEEWTPYPVGTVVTYQCTTGYINIGTFRRYRCTAKGHWSPSRLPICRKLKKGMQKYSECSAPPTIPFARIENVTNGSNPSNSAVFYVCDEGFILEGSPNLVCDISGQWQPLVGPTCRPNIILPDDCLKPPPPSKTEASREIIPNGKQMVPFLVASMVSAVLLTILVGVQLTRKGCWKYFAGWTNNRVLGCGDGDVSPGPESGSVGVIPPVSQRDHSSLLCCEPDRVALLNSNGCRQVLPPTYEEAIQQSGPPPSEFLYGCILPSYHRNRYRFVSLRSTRDTAPYDQSTTTTTTNTQTRPTSSSTSHSACGRSSSVADSLNSTDTVTPSEVSTTVTVDTLSSTTSHPTSSTSTRAFCGSLASFDTMESDSALNLEGVPLLEETECEQGVSPSSETRTVLETT